jgi:hypothetical protein
MDNHLLSLKVSSSALLFHGTIWSGSRTFGHFAIGDLLVCRALQSALSANFDSLIEQCANRLKIAMRGALDGQEAAKSAKEVSPLVKFHGCLDRNREKTLWTTLQLPEAAIAKRVESCSQWMNLNLPGKDLLVVGFWSDWGYLNDVIAKALDIQGFGSVTVVDPNSSANLKLKAPQLWQRLSGTAAFEHLVGSGPEALEELRMAFSKVWLKRFYALGKVLLEGAGLPYAPIDPTMSCDELYACRRDAEGTPNNRAATMKAPSPQLAMAAFFHHLLRNAGSFREGPWHVLNGKCIRIVQGAGEALSTVKARFKEPPALKEPDFVVCAGSCDVACPSRIIASGVGKSVVRPGSGGEAIWMTLEQARTELGIDKPSAATGTGGV